MISRTITNPRPVPSFLVELGERRRTGSPCLLRDYLTVIRETRQDLNKPGLGSGEPDLAPALNALRRDVVESPKIWPRVGIHLNIGDTSLRRQ